MVLHAVQMIVSVPLLDVFPSAMTVRVHLMSWNFVKDMAMVPIVLPRERALSVCGNVQVEKKSLVHSTLAVRLNMAFLIAKFKNTVIMIDTHLPLTVTLRPRLLLLLLAVALSLRVDQSLARIVSPMIQLQHLPFHPPIVQPLPKQQLFVLQVSQQSH